MSAAPAVVSDTMTIAKALAHPTRVRILAAFARHETIGAAQLAREWNVPVSAIAYHVRRLADLGVIRLVARVANRGAVEHRYEQVPIVLGDLVSGTIAGTGPPPAAAEFGAALRTVREQRGVSHRQLARCSGARERYVAALERGDADPRLSTLTAVAGALHARLTLVVR